MRRPDPRDAARAYESGTVPIDCSGWPSPQQQPVYPALEGSIETDVVVIGAGLAGASVSLHLAELGVATVTLEAKQPATGASGRNAGHVQPYLDVLEPLQAWPDQGKRLLHALIENRNIVYDLCRKHGIQGDASPDGLLEAAFKPSAALEKKAATWRAYGYDVQGIDANAVRAMLGTERYRWGIHWKEGGRVNPYLFTNGMIAAAARLGARVHGDSPVLSCERDGQRWRVKTPQGTVTARRVVICTSNHAGNRFFPHLAQTQYPLVACGLATRPLPDALLKTLNPARVVFTQYPAGLYPLVIDGRNRLITATIPGPGKAGDAATYFKLLLRFLHRTFPQSRDFDLELESYWTGVTASSSHVYHQDYAKYYRVDDNVFALMNLGTWGNVMGPLLGQSLARALAAGRPEDCVLPLEAPRPVKSPGLFEFKVRRLMIPAARLLDTLGMA
ncbi:MAG: FAD-binding oxidoreductase [Proteobacteria bacterium]|nr:FAD-binding oxidoreductase [Pseudomonadota bacterium]